jgi:DNA-binding transcriptional ArsR family regulator
MPLALRQFKASLFQALAHPTRVAIVELLRDRELSAGQIQEQLQVEQANLSQHLAVLRARQVVVNRKAGNQVYYSLAHPVLTQVLDLLRQHFYAQLNETVSVLKALDEEQASRS